jgi:hypothetical protein
VALVAMALAMVGCATIRGFPEPPRVEKDKTWPAEGYQMGPDAIREYNEATGTAKKIVRNEIIDARMAEIDSKFADYERALYQEGIGSGVGTDWAVLSITAATTIVGAAKTKTALGAIATAIVGGHAAFDKRALFDKTLPALMAQMVAEREKIRVDIRVHEVNDEVESYTWFAAESDLRKFEYAGSIPGAISVVSLDAGQKAAKATQDLKELTTGKFGRDAATAQLRQFWKPDGTNIDANNQTKLKTWMQENGLDNSAGTITMFLNSAAMAELRSKAVKDLNLPAAK